MHSEEITGGGFVEVVGGDVWEELVVFIIRLVEGGLEDLCLEELQEVRVAGSVLGVKCEEMIAIGLEIQ